MQIRKMPGAESDRLGTSVALSAGFVAAGADGLGADPTDLVTGSVYVANIPDCDRNGIPDSCEDLADDNLNGLPDLCEVGLEATPSDTCLPPFKRGDANGDGSVSGLGDGLFVLRWHFIDDSPVPMCMDAADANDNGEVTGLGDGLFVLRWQFVDGAPVPPDPGPTCCGRDPTDDDDLDCETPPVCD